MSCGIKEDSKRRTRLKIRFNCPQGERVRFGGVEVRDRKIHMQLLRYRPFGPRGCDERLDFLEPERRLSFIEQLDPHHVFGREVAQRFNFESRELRIKGCELEGIEAVERRDIKSNLRHRLNVVVVSNY